MFTNRQVNGYVYETRYIASWLKVGGSLRYKEDIDNFYKWLLSTGLDKEEANHIKFLATNGRLELETNAREFIKNIEN